MLRLHELTSLVKKRKRIGRGGSRGGTSGKGHKGQKARSGGSVAASFEGGQMPLYRRLPKRGFNNVNFGNDVVVVNIADIERAFDSGAHVDIEALQTKGLINIKKGQKKSANLIVKVLGSGTLTKKLTVSANAFSESASKAIVDLGGEVRIVKG